MVLIICTSHHFSPVPLTPLGGQKSSIPQVAVAMSGRNAKLVKPLYSDMEVREPAHLHPFQGCDGKDGISPSKEVGVSHWEKRKIQICSRISQGKSWVRVYHQLEPE